MNIKEKERNRELNRIIFHVNCPKCGYEFFQIGRWFNFWRDMKNKHNLNQDELRKAQKQVMKDFLEGNR